MKHFETAWRWVVSVVRAGWRRVRELTVPSPCAPPPAAIVHCGRMDLGANYTWVVWQPGPPPGPPPPGTSGSLPTPLVTRPIPAEVLRQLQLVSECGAVLVATLREAGRPGSHAALIVTPAQLRVTPLDKP